MSVRSGNGGYRCLCPACGSRMRIKDSDMKSPTVKTMYAQCTNIGCSQSILGSLSWDYALTPSGMDRPRVTLPVAPSVAKMKALREEKRSDNQLDMLDAAGDLEKAMHAAEPSYREQLDSAARAFLERHQAEHLDEGQTLVERAAGYLVETLNAEPEEAENAAVRAFGGLGRRDRRYLDISGSTSSVVVIADPDSGAARVVPVELICRLLLDREPEERLRATT